MYIASLFYRIRRRICDVATSAPAQFTVFVHLIVYEPALFGRRDDVCILACEALVGEPTCFGGCTRLNSGGNLRRLVPQGGQFIMWEDPGTEVRYNRIRFHVGFGVNMKEVHSSGY
jgi:hypothetical protein